MTENLIDILTKLPPSFLKQLDEAATAGLKKDKLTIYEWMIKTNPNFKYEQIDELLTRHQNGTVDVNWNHGEYIYRMVFSRRKMEKERRVKDGTNNQATNGANESTGREEGSRN